MRVATLNRLGTLRGIHTASVTKNRQDNRNMLLSRNSIVAVNNCVTC